MRIAAHSLDLSSQHVALETTRRQTRMAVIEAAPGDVRSDPPSESARAVTRGGSSAASGSLRASVGAAPLATEMTAMDTLRTQLLRLLLERLTGREIRVLEPADLEPKEPLATAFVPARDRNGSPAAAGFGVAWWVEETRIEIERSAFQAQGSVRTADGEEIAIDIALTMSREFMQHTRMEGATAAELQDPLVINFDAPAAALTDTRFAFDLDADGKEQQVAFLQPGSGFLALDRSGNGQVDDGSELFGPRSGDGFSELRRHDHDGNAWIDKADPVYDRLRVWTRDAQGRDQLLALGEAGVGAIYLGHVSTPFDLRRGDDNSLLGQVRSTGLWVNEDGHSGTVQQIDLTA
ncbi:MAG: hypothetical protein KGY40_03745 [Thioalkalivibrio sp.]|jgi:hypothetical protein|nr:hypothetical protein [Thioalkalivibrio sp.]